MSTRLARRQLAHARRLAREATPAVRVVRHYNDGALLAIHRGHRIEDRLRIGPNSVHVMVSHPDGSYEDLGESRNLLTNIGRDWWAQAWGFLSNGVNAVYTANSSSATSIGVATTPFTASNLATPQLGCAGLRIWADNGTNEPVYGNIVSNTTSALTVDQWWTWSGGIDATGATPSSTAKFQIGGGNIAAARFIALSTDSGSALASHTTLTSEVTSNGGGRALGTYAHTYGNSTLTLTKAFSITGTITAIHKAGAFACLTSAGADPMIYETVLNADATVVNGDTLTVTWTFTLSG